MMTSPSSHPPAGDGSAGLSAGWAPSRLVLILSLVPLIVTACSGTSASVRHPAPPSRSVPPSRVPTLPTPLITTRQVVSPPPAIPADCSQDVTGPLLAWLYSLPVGTPSQPLTVKFANGGCYQIDGSLMLRGFADIVLDGNGATFRQEVPQSQITPATPVRSPYCGTTAFSRATKPTVTLPIMWWFEGGCDVVLESMKIDGMFHGAALPKSQQDSAIQINGGQRFAVIDDSISNVYGDFVTISGLHEAPAGGASYPSQDVLVSGNSFTNSGRQGVTSVYVNRVAVTNNQISQVSATVFDIESDVIAGTSSNILIQGNSISTPRYAYLLAGLTGSQITDLAFMGNQLTAGAQMRIALASGAPMSNVTVVGNVATGWATWPFPAIAFRPSPEPVANVLIASNKVPTPPWNHGETDIRGEPFVSAGSNLSNITVRDNLLPLTYGWAVPHKYRTVLPLASEGAQFVVSCGNSQSPKGGPIDGPCRHSTASPAQPAEPAPPNMAT
jgi:hypothetical protein